MSQEKTARRRAQIIAAAMDCFAEKGFHSTRIADIAAKLSIGHGTFYRYFDNKLDIFNGVIDQIIDQIRKVTAEDGPEVTNTREEYQEQIQRFGNHLYSLFLKDTRIARILFYELPGIDPDLDARMNRVMGVIEWNIEMYLKNGINKGFLKKGLDTEVLAKAVNAMIFGGARDIMDSPPEAEKGQRWTDAVGLLMIEGMGAGPARNTKKKG